MKEAYGWRCICSNPALHYSIEKKTTRYAFKGKCRNCGRGCEKMVPMSHGEALLRDVDVHVKAALTRLEGKDK